MIKGYFVYSGSGQNVAEAESNAIVFATTFLGRSRKDVKRLISQQTPCPLLTTPYLSQQSTPLANISFHGLWQNNSKYDVRLSNATPPLTAIVSPF